MTKEQAIAIIRQECLCVDRDCNIEKNCGNCDLAMPSKEPILEAYNMAIKALNQEPCDDCISRKEVLDGIINSDLTGWQESQALQVIEDSPSVQPKHVTGRWTRELIRNEYGGCIGAKMICSECRQDNGYDKRMKFCPNCGAKMQEVEE